MEEKHQKNKGAMIAVIAIILVIGIIAAAFYLIMKRSKSTDQYATYRNSRYEFSVEYPASWKLGEAPTNNDGREFISPDAQTTCRAFGFANALPGESGNPQSLDEYINWIIDNNKESASIDKKQALMDTRKAMQITLTNANNIEDAVYSIDDEIGYGLTCVYANSAGKEAGKNVFNHMIDSFKIDKQNSASSSPPVVSASPASSPMQTSCSQFNAAESEEVVTYKTYQGTDFIFQYPNSWTITESANLITAKGEDSGEDISFSVRTREMADLGFEGLNLVDTRAAQVGCVDSEQTTFDGENNLTLIANSFTTKGIKYLLIFSFKDIGASYAGDIADIQKIILKTFNFN